MTDIINTILNKSVTDVVVSRDIQQKGIESFNKIGTDITGSYNKTISDARAFGDNLVNQGSGIVNNTVNQAGHTVRYVDKSLTAVVDNQLDQLFQFGQDIRSDVVDIIELALLTGLSITIIILILYGDKLFDEGLQVGNVKLF